MRSVLTVRLTINILAAAAVITVLCIEFLKDVPELFNKGSEIGEIVYRVALSIISSYVFYLIVTHGKAEIDKENINVYLERIVKRIYRRSIGQLVELARPEETDPILIRDDKEAIVQLFQRRSPMDAAPMVSGSRLTQVSWLQYLNYYREEALLNIDQIFKRMPFLDSELVATLSELENCQHFISLKVTAGNIWRNQTMEVWADDFYDYLQICRKLEEYHKRKLVRFASKK